MIDTSLGPRRLAQLTGVSTDTLRHYERLGLLPGTARTRAAIAAIGPTLDKKSCQFPFS
jgi:hypothetical protein